MSAAVYRRHPRALWRRVPAGAVVLPPGVQEPLHLNGPAALVWLLFDEGASLKDVRDAVAALCDTTPQAVAEDVTGTVAYLVGAGTLEAVR